MPKLIEKFDLSGLNTSPAVFDPQRLQWMNGIYIRELPLEELFAKVSAYWPPQAEAYDDDYKKQVLALVQERLKFFAELSDLTVFFFKDLPVDPELVSQHKQLKKLDKDTLKDLLSAARNVLEKNGFEVEELTEELNQLLVKTKQKPAVLFSLVRIATTQAPASPGLAETLAVLGKERSLKRIEQQLQALS